MSTPRPALIPAPQPRYRRRLLVSVALLTAMLTFTLPSLDNANVKSRLATAEALVERHTFQIDRSTLGGTQDRVFIAGHFYSEKPPLLAVLAAAVYYPLHAAGFELRPWSFAVPFAVTFLTIGLSWLLCLACFHDAMIRAGTPDPRATWITTLLATATIALPWSLAFNNHSFPASWLFIGFYCLLRACDDARPGWMWLAGIAFALAVAADYSVAVFFAAFSVYAGLRRELRGRLLCLTLPVLIAVGASLGYNYAISGSLRPVQIRQELFMYRGSHWRWHNELLSGTGFRGIGHTLRYGQDLLFGGNGFLVYNPLLLLAIWEAAKTILKRERYWREAVAILAACAVFIGYYAAETTNYGGDTYSVRWFVPIIPLLWFFSPPYFKLLGRTKRLLLGVLTIYSVIIAVMGTVNPWTPLIPAFTTNLVDTIIFFRYTLPH